MKHSRYRWFSILALMAVLLLQVVWMANTFALLAEQMLTDSPQAHALDVFLFCFRRMWILLLATVLTSVALVAAVMEQLRLIDQQEALARIRNDFSYAMVHDMKSPLSSITMGIKMLRSGKLDEKPAIKEEYYRIVGEEAQHLLALTNRLLTISKLEDKRLLLNKTELRLQPAIDDIITKYRLKTDKPLTADVQLAAPTVWADEEYMCEVLINLVDNAVKYSRDNIRLTIRSEHARGGTTITVRDEGIGISRDALPHIFQKFERAVGDGSRKNDDVPGFGLGLNYVYQVMRAHDGHVKAASKKGRWTQFTLFLPA